MQVNSQNNLVTYAFRLTQCQCGHAAVEHYDSYDFCTWTVGGECDCQEFCADGPEIHMQVGNQPQYARRLHELTTDDSENEPPDVVVDDEFKI